MKNLRESPSFELASSYTKFALGICFVDYLCILLIIFGALCFQLFHMMLRSNAYIPFFGRSVQSTAVFSMLGASVSTNVTNTHSQLALALTQEN